MKPTKVQTLYKKINYSPPAECNLKYDRERERAGEGRYGKREVKRKEDERDGGRKRGIEREIE